MALHVHRADRTDALADALGRVLLEPVKDPFTADVVAVPTKGVERFLAQRLSAILGAGSHGDGVCANVTFCSPAELIEPVAAAIAGREFDDIRSDPWSPGNLRWSVLATVDEHLDQDWAEPVRHYLGGAISPIETTYGSITERPGRRVALASMVAGLFHAYSLERPDMITSWAAGDDSDGFGNALPPDQIWQPRLWRIVRSHLGPSLAEMLPAIHARLDDDPQECDLPARCSVFGPTHLPQAHLSVLRSLALRREVHLWIPDTSPVRWRRLTGPTATREPGPEDGADRRLGRAPADSPLAGNPLLLSLGRDGADFALRLGGSDPDDLVGPVTDPSPAHRLLGWIQEDLRSDVAPSAEHRTMSADDRSVQIHACHGRTRQVEVLRETLLAMLQADPTLQPRDILVMSPDIAGFGPMVAAAFGIDADPGSNIAQPLRARIADRTREQHNGVLAALAVLLDLADGRFPATAVLDFAALPCVSHEFGFDEDGLGRLRELVVRAGVRWGLDEQDRSRFAMGDVRQNTWASGLDRMLLGATMSEDGLHSIGTVLPLDDIEGGDVDVVGQLAEMVDRLKSLATAMRQSHSLPEWVALLSDALTMLTDPRGGDQWQLPAALGSLAAILDVAPGTPVDVKLGLGDLRLLLDDRLAGRPTRSNFRTGGLTFCSMVPMRSVPHRVICLLGMDDGAFPRQATASGDDILARLPRAGERDRAAEDRQSLLDAVMAATQALILTYSAADPRTNERRAPCVPVGELLDTIAATAVPPRDCAGTAENRVLVHHPLQSFDPGNFLPGALGTSSAPFSHDRMALAGARAVLAERQAPPPLVGPPVHVSAPAEVSIDDLARFLRDPAGFYLRERLGLVVRRDEEPPADRLPIELAGLARYEVGARMLRDLMVGLPPEAVLRAERLRGQTPVGPLGDRVATELIAEAREIADAASPWCVDSPRELPVSLVLDAGRRVMGLIPGLHGRCLVEATFSRLQPKTELPMWVRLLTLQAMEPTTPYEARLFARGGSLRLRAPDQPRDLLADLIRLMTASLGEPLPFAPEIGSKYAVARRGGSSPEGALRRAAACWNSRFGEGASESNLAVWGQHDSFAALVAQPPQADDDLQFPDEPTRFGALARHVWDPLLTLREQR